MGAERGAAGDPRGRGRAPTREGRASGGDAGSTRALLDAATRSDEVDSAGGAVLLVAFEDKV